MGKRHRDAYFIINPGAVNPSGIAHSIIEACKEIREEPGYSGTKQLCNDPAIRLMVYQLAHLCGIPEMDASGTVYSRVWDECTKLAAKEEVDA